jgi:AAA15 family ATPase/GTPase
MMIEEIEIKNFKSIIQDKISLGKINVFIGENGCGKTNILEAVATLSASKGNNLNINGLSSKGIRVTKPKLTMSSFIGIRKKENIEISVKYFNDKEIEKCVIYPIKPDDIYSEWRDMLAVNEADIDEFISSSIYEKKLLDNALKDYNKDFIGSIEKEKILKFIKKVAKDTILKELNETNDFLTKFLIYNLNTHSLRGIINNSKEIPLGINGEGLDVLLHDFSKDEWNEIKKFNYLISWLDEIIIDETDALKYKGHKLGRSSSYLYFKDKFMKKKNNIFATENSNEGVLNVLFYLALFISHKTPDFFAIDNIDNSLNPHLCQHLMAEICELSKNQNKQVLITTHNPSILDGLNLFDDEIRLFEVKRLDDGSTKTRRIKFKPEMQNDQFKLSELWSRGFLGAISQNF